MGAYVTILKKLEDKTIKTPFNFDRTNPAPYLKNKQIGYYEKFQLIGKLLGYYSDKYSDKRTYQSLLMKLRKRPVTKTENIPTKVRIHRRLLTYFFKTHMRTKLVRLHSLYLREIVLQNKGEHSSKEIEELRGLDSDVKHYLDILPKPTKALGIFGSGIVTAIAIMQLLHLDTAIINKSFSLSLGDVLGGIIVAAVYGMLFATPIIRTFAIKRVLFLKTNSWYDYLDIYLGKGDELYKKSIYRLEDELFEALDARGSKPKESPIDFWIQLALRGPIFVFFGVGIFQKLIDWLIFRHVFTSVELSIIAGAGIIMPIAAFFYFVSPYLEYRRRRNHNLL